MAQGKPSYSSIVDHIQVRGNQRVEDEAILAKIKSQPGEKMDLHQVARDIRALFDMGYFNDISVFLENKILIFDVVERKRIQALDYIGNSEIDDEELSEIVHVQAFELLDESSLEESLVAIRKAYEDKGFFLTQVSYKVEEYKGGKHHGEENKGEKTEGLTQSSGTVRLKIIIKENQKVKVKKVRFIGNVNLEEAFLKSNMLTRPAGLFGGGNFKEEDLQRDHELLKFLYLNEGYVQAKIHAPQVAVTPDKRSVEILFKIDEGLRYKVGQVRFKGDLLKTPDDFLEVLKIDDTEYFSQQVLVKDMSELQLVYGDEGYAYANIIPQPLIQDKGVMDIVFQIVKGQKVSIGTINIKGNTKTRDKVIRREVRLIERDLYSETAKRESLANLKRLGYFKNVDLQSQASESDVMDIDIEVEETSTGTLNLGVGFGGFQGFAFQGSMSQMNLLGYGKSLNFSINWSENIDRLFNLNYTDPYFLDTLWSLGIDAYQTRRFLPDFQESRAGGALRLGRQLTDRLRTSFRYKLDDTILNFSRKAFRDIYPVFLEKESEGLTSSLTWYLEFDQRNNRLFPTQGFYTSLSFEYGGLGGDLNYSELIYNMRYYRPLVGSLILRNNLAYGLLFSNSSNRETPLSQKYRLGGANTIRGYKWYTISKRVYSNEAFKELEKAGVSYAEYKARRPFGGDQQIYYNLELEWALVKEAGIKGVIFFDVGQAEDHLNFSHFKSSYGTGIRWITPLGPLRFEWGFPIRPDKHFGEKSVEFDFSISSTF